jgi:hypothetical protein
MCEMCGCGEPATKYAGYAGADAWAGRVCTAHALGMAWMENLKEPTPVSSPSTATGAAVSGDEHPPGTDVPAPSREARRSPLVFRCDPDESCGMNDNES